MGGNGSRITVENYVEAITACNGLISKAARMLQCTPQAIYAARDRHQAIQDAIDNCRNAFVDEAEAGLRGAVLDREPWAVALVVQTLGKSRGYVKAKQHEVEPGEEMKKILEHRYGNSASQ